MAIRKIPDSLTKTFVAEIERYAYSGMTLEQIAASIGLSRPAFNKLRGKFGEVDGAIKKGRERRRKRIMNEMMALRKKKSELNSVDPRN